MCLLWDLQPQVFKILALLMAVLVVLVVVMWYHCGDEILTFLDLDAPPKSPLHGHHCEYPTYPCLSDKFLHAITIKDTPTGSTLTPQVCCIFVWVQTTKGRRTAWT